MEHSYGLAKQVNARHFEADWLIVPLAVAARFTAAALLLYAAAGKLAAPASFRRTLAEFGGEVELPPS